LTYLPRYSGHGGRKWRDSASVWQNNRKIIIKKRKQYQQRGISVAWRQSKKMAWRWRHGASWQWRRIAKSLKYQRRRNGGGEAKLMAKMK